MANGQTPEILEQVQKLVKRGALFVSNNSGGKDSQVMLATLCDIVPRKQILSLHASLGEDGKHVQGVEWPDTMKWVRYMSEGLGVEVATCQADKTLFEMIDRSAARLKEQGRYDEASPWPSPKFRQCTSDLKRGPLEKAIKAHIKSNGLNGIVVNCMGLRAQESSKRAQAVPWQRKKAKETSRGAVREWYEWLPIHHLRTEQVFSLIAKAGQKPHWAYEMGMTRLSCCFCIMANEQDLKTAARLRPELYERYVIKERELGKTMRMDGQSLEQVTGVRLKVVA
jgi:DNA sulfur modification protein DndC